MKSIYYIGVALLFLVSCGTEETTVAPAKSSSLSTTETCPHCSGLGRRQNTITGIMSDCSSCGGDGKVTGEQYKRLSK